MSSSALGAQMYTRGVDSGHHRLAPPTLLLLPVALV